MEHRLCVEHSMASETMRSLKIQTSNLPALIAESFVPLIYRRMVIDALWQSALVTTEDDMKHKRLMKQCGLRMAALYLKNRGYTVEQAVILLLKGWYVWLSIWVA